MNEQRHTPGPWNYDSDGDGAIIGADGYQVAYNIGEKDGPLIAAAPDLLELANQIILAHEQEESSFPADIVAGAYAALSKAKGG